MDNKRQSDNDNRPLVKKLVLPLTFFIGGLLIFIILYKFLLADKSSLAMSPEAQEAFQAPAEISASLQIECQASVEKIDRLSSCEEKETEFLNKAANCTGYNFALENPASINSDGQYSDIVFHVVDCYKKAGSEKNLAATNLLKKIQQDLPAWQVNMGPITCSSASLLEAYLNSYSPDQSFICMKPPELDKIVAQLQNKNLNFLPQMVWSQHIPKLGLRDADMSCPETIKQISASLMKVLSKPVTVGLNSEQKADSSTTFVEINSGNEQVALLKIATNPDGCLYLDSLLVSNLDGVE